MYKHDYDNDAEKFVRLFAFPRTLAGDATLSVFIQTGTTWIIEAFLVQLDIHSGRVTPVAFFSEPKATLRRWFFALDSTKTENPSMRMSIWFHVSRILAIALPAWALLWGPSIGIMSTFGIKEPGTIDVYYESRWAGPLFKLVYASVLAVFTTPIMTSFWILRAAWAKQKGSVTLKLTPGISLE
ncbi:hypothetical protein Cpir12675_000641 [Ceratocystis pirilliformis]|uniref:Uncharacterized protein n=1 Tax=Ceratocystis pirilliformis TaxID=259994 RepID=A0ABR3ZLS6_9PEZI